MTPHPFAPKTILVTGACGFIGSHTVDLLVAHGHRVIAVDDLSSGRLANTFHHLANDRLQLEHENILRPRYLERLCSQSKPDAIIHLAGLVSVALGQLEPQRNFQLNIEATQIVAEAARITGVPRIVFASSAAVYGDSPFSPLVETHPVTPASNYGNAKLLSELILLQYARSYGLTTACNRYFNVFGPRQDPSSPYSGVISLFIDRFLSGQPVTIFGDGSQTRDFISVEDIALANATAAIAPSVRSGCYNICTGESRSIIELFTILQALFPNAPAPIFEPPRAGDILHSLGAPDRAAAELGFRAQTTFQNGIIKLASALDARSEQAG